jgi:hypothetical protein
MTFFGSGFDFYGSFGSGSGSTWYLEKKQADRQLGQERAHQPLLTQQAGDRQKIALRAPSRHDGGGRRQEVEHVRAEVVEIFAQQGEQAGQLLLSLAPLLLLERVFNDPKLFIQKRFEPFVALPPPPPGEIFFLKIQNYLPKKGLSLF